MIERETPGILSKGDRAFLLGRRTGLSDNAKRKKRHDIRQKVLNSILDFWILVDHLPPKDLDQIFDEHRESPFSGLSEFPSGRFTVLHEQHRRHSIPPRSTTADTPEAKARTVFKEAFTFAIAFLYQGVGRIEGIDFEEILRDGITQVTLDSGKIANVEIELESISADAIFDALEADQLSVQHALRLRSQIAQYGVGSESVEEGEFVCPSCGRPRSDLDQTEYTVKNLFSGKNELVSGYQCSQCDWRGPEMDLEFRVTPDKS